MALSKNTNLEAFDVAMAQGAITQERGQVYDHPRNDFDRIAKLTAALPECSDPRVAHILRMLCIKMCRLSHHPEHLDSWIDIAGYARTGVMVIPEKGPQICVICGHEISDPFYSDRLGQPYHVSCGKGVPR